MADKLAGSPASPILANVCLHVLLAQCFTQNWSAKGEFVRYADDSLFVFSDEETARSFQLALIERMAEAGLRLNLDKTRIVPFSASAPKGTLTPAIWSEAAAKLTEHFRYYGVVCNEAKLSHFRWSCVGALFRWLNRRSQNTPLPGSDLSSDCVSTLCRTRLAVPR